MPVFDPPAGADIYVFATVPVPPTSATSEALVQPGIAQPAPTNRTGEVRLAVTGTLRQDAAMNPTVVVRCVDRGQLPLYSTPHGDLLDRVVTSDDVTIDDLVHAVAAGGFRTVGAHGTPRVAVRRYDYDRLVGPSYDDVKFLAVSSEFARFPNGASEVSAVPPGESGTWAVRGESRLVALPDGAMLLVFATRENGSTSDGDVVVYRYDPAVDADWQALAYCNASTPHSLSYLVDGAAGDFDPWQLAAWYDADADAVWVLVQGMTDALVARAAVLQLTGWQSAATALLSLYSTSFPSELASDYMAMHYARIGVAHTGGGTLVAGVAVGGLTLARSSDLRTWDTITGGTSGIGAFPTFADWDRVYPSGGRSGRAFRYGHVSRIAASTDDATVLWATTTTGQVLKSVDTGATWETLDTPTRTARTIPRTAIRLTDVAAYGSTILAVGERGVIIRSQDAGATWKVIRYGDYRNVGYVFAADDIGLTGGSTILPDTEYTRIIAHSATVWFLLGVQGLLARTDDAGDTWTILLHTKAVGAYTDMVTDGTRALVVGSDGVHANAATAGDRRKRGVFVTNVISGTFAIVGYHLDTSVVPDGVTSVSAKIVTTLFNASTRVWVTDLRGNVAKATGNGTDNLSSFAASVSLPDVAAARRIYVDPADANRVFVFVMPSVGRQGILYRSTNAETSPPTFTAEQVGSHRTGEAAHDLYVRTSGGTTLVAVGTGGILRSAAQANLRVHPCLAVHPDRGDIWLAVSNLQMGEVELWHAAPPPQGEFPAFTRVDHGITFTAQADGYGVDEDYIPRPTITFGDDDTIVVTAGTAARLGLGRGTKWVPGTDTRASLTVGTLATDANYTLTKESINGTRNTLAHAGRLWSVVRRATGAAIATWVAWEWDDTGTQYRPVVPGKFMPLGVDSVMFALSGQPTPGDEWTIAPRYGYRKEHLIEPSPSMVWRSTGVTEQILTWDRQHADVIAALGAGEAWDVDTVVAIATNVRSLYVAQSIGPTDASWSEVAATRHIVGPYTVTAPDGRTTTNVLLLSGVTLTEGYYNPGIIQFYAYVLGVTDAPVYARVVRSGTNHIVLDRTVTGLSGATVYLVGDRHWATLTQITGRYLRMRIPAQASADAYFEIGTILAGRAITGQTGGDGATWQPVTNTTEDQAPAGPAYVTHYGRTGQLWTMRMPPHASASRNATLNHLLPRLRDPFVIAFGGETTMPQLVRVVDGQHYRQILGQYWDAEWVLREVV